MNDACTQHSVSTWLNGKENVELDKTFLGKDGGGGSAARRAVVIARLR